MSNGEEPDDAPDESEETGAEETADVEGTADTGISDVPTVPDEATEESLTEYFDEIGDRLETAETEADLNDAEALLDDAESALDDADLPEPDEDDEDAHDPRATLEERLDELRSALADARGPYAEDVAEAVASASDTVDATEWTAAGHETIVTAVETFVADAADAIDDPDLDVDDLETLDATAEASDDGAEADDGGAEEGSDAAVPSIADLTAALGAVADGVTDAGLDPDADADTIAALLDVTDELDSALNDAEEWDDLETHEQLRAQGYYDVLGHYKDFPVEWAALKEHEKRGNVDMILLALDSLQSDFMERHCLEALERMGKRGKTDASLDELLGRAGKRDQFAIRILGNMAAEEATETLVEYVEEDSNPGLQKATFKSLGEIGAAEAVQPLANKLTMENDLVRPYAARALGLIGDARAVDPLADALDEDDSDDVRAAAAWALRQIGTREALEAAAAHTDERVYIVQTEAEKAADALDAAAPSA